MVFYMASICFYETKMRELLGERRYLLSASIRYPSLSTLYRVLNYCDDVGSLDGAGWTYSC
jgi:hypothetical protein